MTERDKRIIEAARQSFNEELLAPDYAPIHGDPAQVDRLVNFLDPRPGGRYLDLATGIGAVAFAIAERQPAARITGIDIADQAIARSQAQAQGRANIDFRLTDGRTLDFPDASFDGIASRYALHHFPDAAATLADVRRVLKPVGAFALADAIRHDEDDCDFINRFQALKPDGHVRIYSAAELLALVSAQGFAADQRFLSAITFTRDLDATYGGLIDETPAAILKLYDVQARPDSATLTFPILNVRLLLSAG